MYFCFSVSFSLFQFTSTILYDPARKKEPSSQYQKERDKCLGTFANWNDDEQVDFVEQLLSRMCHYQHGHINAYLKPMLQRDFISLLPKKGLDHVADNILSYLDADSLFAAELVSKEWNRVISEGMLWKKLIERKVRSDSLWRGLAERKKWIKYLFVPRPGEYRNHSFYRQLYPVIMKVSHETACMAMTSCCEQISAIVSAELQLHRIVLSSLEASGGFEFCDKLNWMFYKPEQ